MALPLAVGAFTVVGTTFASRGQPLARPLDILGYTLLLVGPAALGVRRAQPVAGLAVAAAAIAVYLGTGYPFGPIFLAPVLALCFAITAGHRLAAYSIAGTCFAVILLIHVMAHPDQPLPLTGAAAGLAWLVAVIAASEGWRARRERLAQTRAAREEAERRRGSEERLRIAQELHDVLGHHISLINVQAGVALYLMDDDPEQARSALAAIKQSSRELLHEMRATLGVLRGVDEHPPHQPMPGLARLDSLVAETRAAGLPVTVEIHGPKRDLPASVDLAAYRIVQEALTNTRKHAGPARARVVVRYDEHGLTVQVDDDGRGTGSPGSDGGLIASGGNGLPGMRERAQALGGTITAGPRLEGGFQIRAFFPPTASRSRRRCLTGDQCPTRR
jgi:signal transduction histidine kinase